MRKLLMFGVMATAMALPTVTAEPMKGCGACGTAPGAAPQSGVPFIHSKPVAMSVASTAAPRSAARTRATFQVYWQARGNRAKRCIRKNSRDARNSCASFYVSGLKWVDSPLLPESGRSTVAFRCPLSARSERGRANFLQIASIAAAVPGLISDQIRPNIRIRIVADIILPVVKRTSQYAALKNRPRHGALAMQRRVIGSSRLAVLLCSLDRRCQAQRQTRGGANQ